LLGAVGLMAGCSSSSAKNATDTGPVTLRLGYFPNLTHATALVGVSKGIFQKDLGSNVTLKTSTFNAGPSEVTAILSGAIDIGFIGPGPTVNAWAQSHGQAVKVISGAASGGAALVVDKSITSVAQLKGKTLATPQKGNTQDVALRYFLKSKGFKTDLQGGGDVHITPEDNSTTLTAFANHSVAGAWVPEPYASRLVAEGGHVLVDERSLWAGGKFVTTDVIVSSSFLKAHPTVVREFLKGLVDTTDYINSQPAAAQAAANAQLKTLTGKALKTGVLASAWKSITFTYDPLASTLREEAAHGEAVGVLKTVDLGKLYDLVPLNAVLKSDGKAQVSG
jgi:NitT/TauT family transport system substrate-binding protein